MAALRIHWIIMAAAVLVSSCDETPTGRPDPVIPDPLGEVGKILGGEGTQTPPVEEPAVTEEGKPIIPTAEPVPDKPGFVISPYNGKWIDVTGIAVGEAVADPDFPAEEKKYFRVPEPLPVKGEEIPEEGAPETEEENQEPAPAESTPEGAL